MVGGKEEEEESEKSIQAKHMGGIEKLFHKQRESKRTNDFSFRGHKCFRGM